MGAMITLDHENPVNQGPAVIGEEPDHFWHDPDWVDHIAELKVRVTTLEAFQKAHWKRYHYMLKAIQKHKKQTERLKLGITSEIDRCLWHILDQLSIHDFLEEEDS